MFYHKEKQEHKPGTAQALNMIPIVDLCIAIGAIVLLFELRFIARVRRVESCHYWAAGGWRTG